VAGCRKIPGRAAPQTKTTKQQESRAGSHRPKETALCNPCAFQGLGLLVGGCM
jgi:hypothetical protein